MSKRRSDTETVQDYVAQKHTKCHDVKLKRERYLEQIRPYYDSDMIKVITRVRRCGKSVLLDTIKDELTERGISGSQIIYLNLEDMDYDYIVDASDLNKEIKARVSGSEDF